MAAPITVVTAAANSGVSIPGGVASTSSWPKSPQQEAGSLIEPPRSLASAIGTIPDATAAADPPLEPPGVRAVSQGFRVGPKRAGSQTGLIPNSGVFVLPRITSPDRSRR